MTARSTPTTTLIVTKPSDFRALEAAYQLMRYELPANIRWIAKNKSNTYAQLHNSLHDQLNCPYRVFTHDRVNQNEKWDKWAVYALYRRGAIPIALRLDFLSSPPVQPEAFDFERLPFHLLLKLLQIDYFHGEQAGRFVGTDHCYVYARQQGSAHLCLQIDLNEDIRTTPEDREREFKVHGQARRFQRVELLDRMPSSYAYFARKITGPTPTTYFLQLKRSEIEVSRQRKEPLYVVRTREGKRTTLLYHDLNHLESSVGKLLYDFIRGFTDHVARYGIVCRSKERHFTEFIPPKGELQLPLPLLDAIRVFDNRLSRSLSLQHYLRLFSQWKPDLRFSEIADLSASTGPVLVIQDYNKEDFQPGGVLEHLADPYQALYKAHAALPKQSINVNQNKSDDCTAETYLDYAALSPGDADFKLRLEVALAQLYLKDVICYGRSVQERLPVAPTGLVFIRKDHYFPKQPTYETLLSFEDGRLHFLDLRDPQQRQQADALLAQLGIDWEEMYEEMLVQHKKMGSQNEEGKELSYYDIIVGPGLFIELEDLNERVLYDYDEIMRRKAAVSMARPIEHFKLLPHYNEIRNKPLLSMEDLHRRGLLEPGASATTTAESESLQFYRQLAEYDAFLDELQLDYPEISFNALTEGERLEQIYRIFDFQPDKHGRYTRGQIKALYQKRGWFSSEKKKDVHLYEGIWYDAEHCYLVGSSQSMKQQQPRAHLIRRFTIYRGEERFDIRPLLLATSVQFVRYNQYTVYPYAFHLIDLYVENMLRFLGQRVEEVAP